MGYVSNEPLREAFLASDVTATELARRLGYERMHKGRWRGGDDSPVRRALGLCEYFSEGRRFPPQTTMRETTALRYAEALGLDPHEVGL